MGLRLVGTVDGARIELPLQAARNILGSGATCDLTLAHDSVSRQHAELVVAGDRVEVVDLDSCNGTFVGSRRIRRQHVDVGTEVVFGSVTLRVQEVADADLEPALDVHGADLASHGLGRATSTLGLRPADSFATHHLPSILHTIVGRGSPATVAREVGAALHESLPSLEVTITSEGDGVLFQARRDVTAAAAAPPATCRRGPYTVSVGLPHPAMARAFSPLVESAALLLAMVAGWAPPAAVRRTAEKPALPEPATVEACMQQLYTRAATVARGDVGVLICGESGTGKEVLARFIHAASRRSDGPFVALNCASLPRDLLEAELFGIERGVATGVTERPGKFELAHGGTLFLDEIGDMDTETQASILRALQEGEVHRVGGSQPRAAGARVVAATNRDMDGLLAAGTFREDLYYRIATWEVTVPPLRHRPGDIPNLAVHFLDRAAQRSGVRVAGVSRAALDVLLRYRWPGNVRQLEKEMERAALFVSDGGLLGVEQLTDKIVSDAAEPATAPLAERLEAFERDQIARALQAADGDVATAAATLGIGRSSLYRKIKSHGMDEP